MKPLKHIRKIYDCLHRMNMDGHIDRPDKYVAINDIEIGLHELRQAFEYEIKETKKMDKLEEIMKQKTTWAGIAFIATMALPKFGVPPDIVEGIRIIIIGLTAIFLRQGVAKVKKN